MHRAASVSTSASSAPRPPGRVPSSRRRAIVAAAAILGVTAPLALIDDPVLGRATAIAAVYLVVLLAEVVPPFGPTLFLLTATPPLLAPLDATYRLGEVLRWPADPVMALFAGGLALGLAAQRHGIDARIADAVVRLARGRRRRLLALVLIGTAVMSMWMSNIAAAAMMLTALRPLLAGPTGADGSRRALLLALALGANLGGMATPIGT